MNRKVILALIAGILILAGGAAFLVFRDDILKDIESINNSSGPNIPEEAEYRRFLVGTSEIPGYTMEVLNERDFTESLQGNNIYGRTYLHTDNQTTGDKPLENIAFSIINEAPSGREPDFGTSDYVNLLPGAVTFGFVVSEEDLNDPELPNILTRKIVEYTYRLAFPEAEESVVEEATDRVYNSLLEKNPEYIVITRE